MAMVSKSKPVAAEQGGIGSGVFKLLVAVGLLLMLIGYVQTRKNNDKVSRVRKTACYLEDLELPRQAGCWTIQLSPDRFSRRVCLPDGVNFRLEWEKNTPAQIKNGFGKIIYRDQPQTQRFNHGIHAGNKVLQFKGQGWVKIYLEPRP